MAAAAGVRTEPFVQIFRDMGYTTDAAAATGTAYAALQESAPNRWIKGPPSLDHRYLHEDVGWGLVPWAELGDSLGVRTPLMNALIALGNNGEPRHRAPAERYARSDDPILREHAEWALKRLGEREERSGG